MDVSLLNEARVDLPLLLRLIRKKKLLFVHLSVKTVNASPSLECHFTLTNIPSLLYSLDLLYRLYYFLNNADCLSSNLNSLIFQSPSSDAHNFQSFDLNSVLFGSTCSSLPPSFVTLLFHCVSFPFVSLICHYRFYHISACLSHLFLLRLFFFSFLSPSLLPHYLLRGFSLASFRAACPPLQVLILNTQASTSVSLPHFGFADYIFSSPASISLPPSSSP